MVCLFWLRVSTPAFSYNLQFIGMTLLMVKWYLSIFNLLLLTHRCARCVCCLFIPHSRRASSSKTLFINSVLISFISCVADRRFGVKTDRKWMLQDRRESSRAQASSLCLMNYTINIFSSIPPCEKKKYMDISYIKGRKCSRGID